MKKASILIILWILFVACCIVYGEDVSITGIASYYDVKSSSNITASGEEFKENELTCAFMDVPFNTILKVTNIENGKSVFCRVNDRGGFKKYGRIIDLSKGAFKTIGDLKVGLLTVKIEEQPSSKVLVSKQKIYPSYIKTPQDIEDWLIKEGFKYKKDETKEDEWKSPEKTIKDKTFDCEDLAILTAFILEDLGYKNVMLIAVYGEKLAHGICWFQELDGTWSFFSTGVDRKGNSKFYFDCKVGNSFEILYLYFPEWKHIKVCTKQGYPIKTYYRKDLEKGVKNDL